MSARDRILDAAVDVMRARGLAGATTREIARAAGCSEALLYKHFSDKEHIFTAVLTERLPRLSQPRALVGEATVRGNLTQLVEQLLAFYAQSFPIAASILGSPSLRAAQRAAAEYRGGGPEAPVRLVQRYLDGEVAAGRVRAGCDTEAVARVLSGAALFEAFQAAYRDESAVPDAANAARRIVAVALDALELVSD
jgi:AcrR family transcriptional regulator